ncbi:COP9 signalosome (CSN) subunit [Teratosphaeriaceae sp. CCFEE 6253]|nr:COP9 signalosome (CSN) subunit [Teratosphaeriaceae sp. CCFEE 6253]
MDALWDDFATAQRKEDGYLLASTLSPVPPASDPSRLEASQRWTNSHSLQTDLRYKLQYNPALSLTKQAAGAWLDVFAAYHAFTATLLAAEAAQQNAGRTPDADWSAVYESWKEVLNAVYRGYSGDVFANWTIPVLYLVGKYLRLFAIRADASRAAVQRDSGMDFGSSLAEGEAAAMTTTAKSDKLEDAARQINRIFALCLSDRSPLEHSRKWALYYIANLLFATYFRLNSIPLSKNILRSLRAAAADTPPLSQFPRPHQVTFHYYAGVLAFLDEDYGTAETHLLAAYQTCDRRARGNVERILTYLIPTTLLTSHRLPSPALLAQHPPLDRLFAPLCKAIKRADLRAFHAALDAGEAAFVHRRIYLTLERGRDVLLRNLFRRVFLAGGFDAPKTDGGGGDAAAAGGLPVRRTRIPLRELTAALRVAGAEEVADDGGGGGVGGGGGGGGAGQAEADTAVVECLVANAIYKGFVKGYIARERGMVVLSKAGAFPGTGV